MYQAIYGKRVSTPNQVSSDLFTVRAAIRELRSSSESKSRALWIKYNRLRRREGDLLERLRKIEGFVKLAELKVAEEEAAMNLAVANSDETEG